MKVNTNRNSAAVHQKNNDPNQVILSIGMIVKNEEQHLRNCLTALKPIMDAVKCELIIVDTGSTDNTPNIAEEFTDQLYYFEWCNDFAAARNFGLEKATGKWFLYIDADEYFISTKEIIHFLNNPSRDKFDVASYPLRSFLTQATGNFSDFMVSRFHKIHEGMHFVGPIHERINHTSPVYHIITTEAIAHHFGYSDAMGEELIKKKHARNIPLILAELEKNPDDLIMLIHIIKEYVMLSDHEKIMEYCNHGLMVASDNFIAKTYFYRIKAMTLIMDGKLDEATETINQYFEEQDHPYTTDIEMHLYTADISKQKNNDDSYINECDKYFEKYDQFMAHTLYTDEVLLDAIPTAQEKFHDNTVIECVKTLIKLWQYERCFKLLDRINIEKVYVHDDNIDFLPWLMLVIKESKEISKIPYYYNKFLKTKDDAKTAIMRKYINRFIIDNKDNSFSISKLLVDKFPNDNSEFMMPYKLRVAFGNEDFTSADKYLDSYFSSRLDEINPDMADFFYFALRRNFPLSKLSKAIDIDMVGSFQILCSNTHDDLYEATIDYVSATKDVPKTLEETSFYLYLKGNIIPNAEISENTCLRIFESYAREFYAHIKNLFAAEVLNPQNIFALPGGYRFGYFIGIAYEALDNDDEAAFFTNLKLALRENEAMRKPIDIIVQRYVSRSELKKSALDEFEEQAKNVKENFLFLISTGEFAAAEEILQAYELINPNDDEIPSLKNRLVNRKLQNIIPN